MKAKALLTILLLVLVSVMASTAFASGPPKDTLNVTGNASNNGVTPSTPGDAPNQIVYAYCLPSGSALSDTLNIDFSVSNTNSTSGQTYTIHLDAVGSAALKNGTTVPANFSLSDNGAITSKQIVISTAVLADGNYDLNIQVSTDPPGQLTIAHDTIHVQVTVGASCTSNAPTCFFTDSSFNFLTDCSGADVTSNSGGTFQIVSNTKNRVVATNPGQFYYNLIWTNTGATQPVTITFTSTGLTPQGANAVHAKTFNASGFTADDSAFDMVNQDGTPCGPTGPCTITVNAGDVLWVTWHVEYSGIGASTNGLSNTCPGNAAISATGTITDANGATLATCSASASGYLKK